MQNEKPVLKLSEFIYQQAKLAESKLWHHAIKGEIEYEDMYINDQDGDIFYTDVAQELFNDFYDEAEIELLRSYRKGA